MRYIFLLGGFLVVVVLADVVGGSNKGILVSIGGAIVYTIFSVTKPKD